MSVDDVVAASSKFWTLEAVAGRIPRDNSSNFLSLDKKFLFGERCLVLVDELAVVGVSSG